MERSDGERNGASVIKSAVLLRKFLKDNYIDNPKMGSPNMDAAIRDLLTDLLHVQASKKCIPYLEIKDKLHAAYDVYVEEKNSVR